jgi:hypothetical protein
MTTPSSPNPISADQIRNEFGASGANNSVSLGAYRVKQSVSVLSDLPLDTGVPQGNSAINFGSFRGKKLNVVIDCTAPSGQWRTKVNARQDYNDNNNITVIGGFKTRPPSSAGTKVIIHTNGNIGSYVYLSRAYKGVYCTYDVYDGDVCDDSGCYPTYRTIENQGYGYLRFYASPSEIKSTDYTIENKYCIRMFPRQETNTTELYRLYSPTTLDHLYTIDVNVWNKRDSGYNQQGIVGYVYGYAAPFTEPVYSGYKYNSPPSDNCATSIDRFFTTNVNDLYNNGFTVDGNPAFYAPTFVNDPSSVNSCSLLTGSWDTSTELIVDIGPSARIYGAGGNGGNGGKQAAAGDDGGPGTSALGVNATNSTTIRVASGAIVRGGGGGGGGGGGAVGARVNKGKGFVTHAGGGGGGGGQGYPGGANGDGGVADDPQTREPGNKSYGSGTAGGAGSLDTAGNAGNGGAGTLGTGCQAFGGGGGGGGFAGGAGSGRSSEGRSSAGGSAGTTSKGGDGGNGGQASSNGQNGSVGEGGKGGASGYGIIVNTAKTNITYSNNGSVSSEVYSTDPS